MYDYLCSYVSRNTYLLMFLCFYYFFPLLLLSLFIYSFEYGCTSIVLFNKLRIKNKQILVRTYTCKYSQSDIKNQAPLTSRSGLCNRINWLVTAMPKFIHKWNHRIKSQNIYFRNFHESNARKVFPCLYVTFFIVRTDYVLTYFLRNFDTKKLLASNNCDSSM